MEQVSVQLGLIKELCELTPVPLKTAHAQDSGIDTNGKKAARLAQIESVEVDGVLTLQGLVSDLLRLPHLTQRLPGQGPIRRSHRILQILSSVVYEVCA